MEDDISDMQPISEAEWTAAIEKLARRSEEKEIFVQILWSHANLCASVYRPHISEQTFHAYLRPQSPGDRGDNAINVRLPDPQEDFHEYQIHENETGEIFLSVARDDFELQIATSVEFLVTVTNDTRVQ